MESMTKVNGKVTVQQSLNPQQLLTVAVSNNLDIDKLERLMSLQKEWQTDQARRAFFSALAQFQMDCPDLRKNKLVDFGPGKANYHYAPLADIDRQIKPIMKANGLSKRWEIQDDKDVIKVTCLITHTDGHTERTTMQGTPDDSGGKNRMQQRGSSIEYMKRYTIIGALGITTADNDIDARLPSQADIDKLHKDFMEVYNQLIQIDSSYTKYSVDNWKGEPTAKNYIKAIGELRKLLAKEKLK